MNYIDVVDNIINCCVQSKHNIIKIQMIIDSPFVDPNVTMMIGCILKDELGEGGIAIRYTKPLPVGVNFDDLQKTLNSKQFIDYMNVRLKKIKNIK